MAQNFRRFTARNVGKSASTVLTANSFDTIIGIALANTTNAQVFVDVYINDVDSSNDVYLIKNAPIQAGSTLQLIDGGAKYVVKSGDDLKVVSDTKAREAVKSAILLNAIAADDLMSAFAILVIVLLSESIDLLVKV